MHKTQPKYETTTTCCLKGICYPVLRMIDTPDYLTTATSGLHPQVQHQLARIHSHPMRTLLMGLIVAFPQDLVHHWGRSSPRNQLQIETGLGVV